MKIALAEFKTDIYVPGLKNFRRSNKLEAERHFAEIAENDLPKRIPVEMVLGRDSPGMLSVVVCGKTATIVPASNIDFMVAVENQEPAAQPKPVAVANGARR